MGNYEIKETLRKETMLTSNNQMAANMSAYTIKEI